VYKRVITKSTAECCVSNLLLSFFTRTLIHVVWQEDVPSGVSIGNEGQRFRTTPGEFRNGTLGSIITTRYWLAAASKDTGTLVIVKIRAVNRLSGPVEISVIRMGFPARSSSRPQLSSKFARLPRMVWIGEDIVNTRRPRFVCLSSTDASNGVNGKKRGKKKRNG